MNVQHCMTDGTSVEQSAAKRVGRIQSVRHPGIGPHAHKLDAWLGASQLKPGDVRPGGGCYSCDEGQGDVDLVHCSFKAALTPGLSGAT